MANHLDANFMARAIRLAKDGQYTTDPNPRVGCLLVKNAKIIAEGWHSRAGEAHAEIEALAKTKQAKGATAYVTLEPCSHHGKTPPCCDALVSSGVQRVVVAMQDPNPLVAGKGILTLQEAGVIVDCGVLEADARALNPGFIKRMTEGRPFVFSKLAMSLDGRTAMSSGESQWITSLESRQDVHRLRASSSAVLTGINTVLADDSLLNARLGGGVDVVQPIRVVLDSTLKMPKTAKMAKLPGRSIILTCCDNTHRMQELRANGFEIHVLPGKAGRVDLDTVMLFLAQQQINELMVECGATLNGALLDAGLIDEWVVYMAPVILGDKGRGLIHIPGLHKLRDKKLMRIKEQRQVGPDLRLRLTTLESG